MCTHLKAIERAFGIDFWRDKRIRAGDYWTTRIEQAIRDARIHLLLITPRFIERAYIMEHELPAINAKYRNQGDLVVPIVLDRCTWKPFVSALQAVPMSPQGRLLPVSEWKPQAHGFHSSCEQLQEALEAFLGITPGDVFDWSRAP